jgi:carboxypeptidase C (cathepsin A)
LPTFAATAWYHDALADKPADFQAFVAEVENFALQEYAPALLMGSRIDAAQHQQVLQKLARYTGLSEDYWSRANLRIDEGRFTQELQRQRGITTGRVDSRFMGESINPVGEKAMYDPMTTAIGPAYLAAFMDYYRNDLEVADAGNYVVFGDVYGSWDWKHVQPDLGGMALPFPNTSVDLALAMKQNPAMKILVQQGYFDLATPFLATTYYLDHLDITPELRKNITLAMYDAGHMMYVHQPSLVKFKQDLAQFIKGSY